MQTFSWQHFRMTKWEHLVSILSFDEQLFFFFHFTFCFLFLEADENHFLKLL